MPTATALTDDVRPGAARSTADLLAAAGEGDAAAWDEIVRRYNRVVVARVRSFRLQDADALDAIQMTWLRLTENRHQLCHPERLAGWLATTAGRECLRILRQPKYTVSPVEQHVAYLTDPAVGPEQRAVEIDTARAVGRLVAQLSPTRQVLVRALFADDARPYAEVARCIGVPVGSIGPSRARALKQLRWMIVERGLAPGD
jgi:RNA polymerase sigma factor (sigma-70 family)